MNCQQAQENFSPYLDQQLAPGQKTLLETHLAHCPACAAELSAWQRVSVALRGLSAEQVTAPAALRENVLAALRADNVPVAEIVGGNRKKTGAAVRSLFTRARRWAAVAAAALLLTFGAWGANLQMAHNSGQQLAGYNQATGNGQNNPPGGSPAGNRAGVDASTGTAGEDAPGGQGGQNPAGDGTTGAGTGQEATGPGSNAGAGAPAQTGQPAPGTSSQGGPAVVLLSENMRTVTTSVWLKSSSPEQTARQLEQLAAATGATFSMQQLGIPSSGAGIINLTVAPEKYDALLAGVKQAGTVTGDKTEQSDLGDQYLKAYNRLRELQSELAANPENAAQIRSQISDAENLLDRISARSKQYTITVWLNY